MGSNTSKTQSQHDDNDTPYYNEKNGLLSEEEDATTSRLRGLNLSEYSTEKGKEGGAISVTTLDSWEAELLADPKNKLAQNAFGNGSVLLAITDSSNEVKLRQQYFFNVEVQTIGSPSFLNNQKSSGRCWIFATSNVMRAHVIKKYNLKDDEFQLSQAYLFFYDKLEKSNFFLDNIIDTVDEDLDSRLVRYLFQGPQNDGGQWDMIVNLVNKYGVVPNEFFPDNAQATATSTLNYVVTEKLREFGLILRDLAKKGHSKSKLIEVKASMVKEIYKVIALLLGTPPKPTDKLVWEFKDKDGTYKYFETTPLDFYKTHVEYDASVRFSLIHDPRNDFGKLYTVDRLNNISEGKPIEYVNVDIKTIKNIAIKMLKDNEPIFFGSDVGKFNQRETGVLDVKAFDYNLGFGTNLNIDKLERLKTGSSQMTHAMVITGVHIDPLTNEPVRWKIENSWGDQVGKKGYYMMTDEWMNEYVFQIVTAKKYVPKDIYNVWKAKQFNVLPYDDPMGALA
ncbi:uncharacterized protein KQ657_002434 [Scheffersomyces spartinae]|uniref:Cysteine proteinase 1, mitochondrial n=1 Tax=Scheffersomyces spartinae TaxID=45513 RepID=A0A9P7V6F1_9ASCO|nr:uncharacterized protein KQ657_002434 [Scheffersomyces spartinae]KAG7192074.1 hypothetical protein KQ657_002434 [Scheffersomyces spartinae]